MAREFDLIVYGASGFVGKHAVAYLAASSDASRLRWAVAGRDAAKLAPIAVSAGNVPVIVAEASDRLALAELARSTTAVLALAGPFSRYADALVEACVAAGTHYADITGESPWVRSLVDRFHDAAAARGTRIVPMCGFDSIPSDIGAFVTARYAQRELGENVGDVTAAFRLFGGVNGGTLASFWTLFGDPERLAQFRDVQLLTPADRRKPASAVPRDPVGASYDARGNQWLAPFFMSPVNTRVVRRSAGLFESYDESYGERFSYNEYLGFRGPAAPVLASAAAAASFAFEASIGLPFVRDAAQAILPKPGTGPTESLMANGWFRVDVTSTTPGGRIVRTTLADRGDPSNAITAKCACESALALALETDALPGGTARGGVLTPATALGDTIVRRLRAAGMEVTSVSAT